jgi:hypothetical protein
MTFPASSEGLYGFAMVCSLGLHYLIPRDTPAENRKDLFTFYAAAFSATPLCRGELEALSHIGFETSF